MAMGRPKTTAKHLPQRMRMKGENYYHVANGRWTPLGKELTLARIKWAELEGVSNGDTFNDALNKYLASPEFNALAPNTKRSYLTLCEPLRKGMGAARCKVIVAAHIYSFMDKYPSKGGANVALNVIKHAMEKARRAGWIEENPAHKIDRHIIKPRGRYLEDHEYRAIYDKANPVIQAIMILAYLTGARQIDVIKMRLSDVTEEGIFVMQQKTKKKQLFTWTPELREAIDQARAISRNIRGMTLFCTKKGAQYSASTIRKMWADACAKAGIEDAQFRDMRSKAGTDAKEAGQDHQKLLGHTSKAMSDKYVKRFSVDKVEPLRKKI